MAWASASARVEFGVYDDVVLLVTMKAAAESPSRNEKRGRKPKVRPGAVLIKYFRNIASTDLNALFPDVRVVMGIRDQLSSACRRSSVAFRSCSTSPRP